MNDIGARIKRRRKELGYSAEKLAEMVKLSPATIYRYEKNEIANMGADKLQPIAVALATTPGALMGWHEEISSIPNIVPLRRMRVPILGSVAAGEPVLTDEESEEYAETDATAPHCDYGLRVTSDSMEPTIHVGDLVLVRQQEDVADGQIAAVLLDDSATLKRVYHISGGLQLLSENAVKYPPRIVAFEEHSAVRILGLAVALRRNL